MCIIPLRQEHGAVCHSSTSLSTTKKLLRGSSRNPRSVCAVLRADYTRSIYNTGGRGVGEGVEGWACAPQPIEAPRSREYVLPGFLPTLEICDREPYPRHPLYNLSFFFSEIFLTPLSPHTQTHLSGPSLFPFSLLHFTSLICEMWMFVYNICYCASVFLPYTRFCWKQHYVALVVLVWCVCVCVVYVLLSEFRTRTFYPVNTNQPENTRIFKCHKGKSYSNKTSDNRIPVLSA